MKIENRKILITGGGSGIGLGLTERFIKNNNTVLICGRREDVLKEAEKRFPGVITKKCDLEVEADRVELYDWILKNHSDLNVLINNAGIQHWIDVENESFLEKTKKEIEINIIAPLHLSHLFIELPHLKIIANVTSGLSFVPLSKVPVYSATKAFLRSFTLSLRHLLKKRNIEVIEIIPPALNTDLGGKGLHDEYPPVSEFIESIFQQLEEGKNELSFGTSAFSSKANSEAIMPIFNRMNP